MTWFKMPYPTFIKRSAGILTAKFKPDCGNRYNAVSGKAPERGDSNGHDKRGMLALQAVIILICGLLVSLCLCSILETAILSRSLNIRTALAERISARKPSFVRANAAGEIEKLSVLNPFGAVQQPGAQGPINNSLSNNVNSLTLVGTLPNVGAWIRNDGGTHFILKGQQINGYELADIKYGKILVTKNGNNYPLYIILSDGNSAPPAGSKLNGTNKQVLDFSAVEPAIDGREGSVPRELVEKLIMNPYDEIEKMKMSPAEGGGMQLQKIATDSVLGIVGVRQGDIIKAVNGVTISNLSDLTNAVNSMMSGSRFDVTVERGGKSLGLNYRVK